MRHSSGSLQQKPHLGTRTLLIGGASILVVVLIAGIVLMRANREAGADTRSPAQAKEEHATAETWIRRAFAVTAQFHRVYTPCWEGAYGAIGDAYLFAATRDSSLLRFYLVDHDLTQMCEGTWVDDRAWVCMAELLWWKVTGKRNLRLVMDASRRYDDARQQGRLSSFRGIWSWYNWPPGASSTEPIFTNSNMNQMVTVACGLYEATGERRYLRDAILAWNGDAAHPGIAKTWYRGDGRWEGQTGSAAFGHELPWEGTGYCSVAGALYAATHDSVYRQIAVATARRIMDPSTGWVDPVDYYQIRMDGSGAFVNFLLDAYAIAPAELQSLLPKVERMLNHVWTNHEGRSEVTLHRKSDDGIRNGWNPRGGEEGYGVGEIGTVHAQGEAVRAFGTFAYFLLQSEEPNANTGKLIPVQP